MRPQDPRRLLRDVGRRVAELRADRGWTQEALAERADVTVKYVQRIERGAENLTVRSLAWIAGLLRVRVAGLFEPPRSRVVRTGRPPRQARPA